MSSKQNTKPQVAYTNTCQTLRGYWRYKTDWCRAGAEQMEVAGLWRDQTWRANPTSSRDYYIIANLEAIEAIVATEPRSVAASTLWSWIRWIVLDKVRPRKDQMLLTLLLYHIYNILFKNKCSVRSIVCNGWNILYGQWRWPNPPNVRLINVVIFVSGC